MSHPRLLRPSSSSSSPHLERLTRRIVQPQDPSPPTEDIFSSALETLFTDDTQQSHGVPGESVIYRSPRFGDVFLRIPAHPDEERGRTLFAHYLWNAGVIATEGIERGSCDDVEQEQHDAKQCDTGQGEGMVHWDKRFWDVRGLDVLELGAATALPSIVAALSNARTMISTDHPSSPAITTNAIESNFRINVTERRSNDNQSVTPPSSAPSVPHTGGGGGGGGGDQSCGCWYTNLSMPRLHHPPVNTCTAVSVCGYLWGTTTFYATGGFGQLATKQSDLRSFDRIVIADCLWMPAQHENLVKTILTYLKGKKDGQEEEKLSSLPCALVVAGFHTGRTVVKDFFVVATGHATGVGDQVTEKDSDGEKKDASSDQGMEGKLKAAQIFEIDVDGRRRDWDPERVGETKEQSNRWCVCAILVKR